MFPSDIGGYVTVYCQSNIWLNLGLNGIVMLGSNTIQVDGAGYDVDTILQRVGEQLCITLSH